MRIEKRNFSSISEIEERAFCEGYMYAQKEFAEETEKKAKQMININLRLALELV